MSWKKIAVTLALSAFAVTVPAGAASAAKPPKPGPETAVPAQCSVGTMGFTKKGQQTQAWYDGTTGHWATRSWTTARGPFVPEAYTIIGEYGDLGVLHHSTAYAVAPDGTLYQVEEHGTATDGVWTVDVQRTALQSGWQGTSELISAYPYLYRLSNDGLQRSAYRTPTAAGEALAGQWSDVTAMVQVDQDYVDGDYRSATFYVTRSSGALDQVVIGTEPGAVPVVTNLRASGFADVVDLASGYCSEESTNPDGMPLLGITDRREARVWFDADKTNNSGADITGGSVVANKLKDTFFGQ